MDCKKKEFYPDQSDCEHDNQCGTCYWYSYVGVEACDREHDPTTSDSVACQFYENKNKV